MTATQFFLLLRARIGFLWCVFGVVVALALIGTFLWPKTYLGEVSVVYNSVSADPISGALQSPDLLPTELATQLQVIASHSVAVKVVDKLALTQNPYFVEKYQDATDGRGSPRDWIADLLIKKYLEAVPSKKNLKQSKQSSVIDIDVYSHDAKFSADMANAFADAYVQTHLELKMEPSGKQAAWFAEQLLALRTAMEASQKRLTDYQRAESVVGTDERIDVENARLQEISTQLIAAQAAMYDGQTRLAQMNRALQNNQLQELPDVSGNTLIQTLKANLSVAEGRLAQMSSGFGSSHPDYISAEAQVKELRRKLRAEVDVVKGTIVQSAAISVRQEAELQNALDRQRDRVLQLKHEKDVVDGLKREVDSAQAAYNTAAQRATQVSLESRLNQSSIAVLSPAYVPIFPAQPKLLLNMLIATFMGVLIALAMVFIGEILNPRVRSAGDVERIIDSVVLAELPWLAGSRHGARSLRQVFSLAVPETRGDLE